MFDGFLRAAAATPDIRVADCGFNGASAAALVSEAYEQGVNLLVLPELCLTGYTCSDLFLQESLLDGAKKALITLMESTRDKNMVVLAGLPMTVKGGLYNVAAVLHDGEILGFVPKSYLPTYSEFYEGRHYHSGAGIETEILFNGRKYPFGTKLLFRFVKTFGLRSRQVSAMHWQVRQSLPICQPVMRQRAKIFIVSLWSADSQRDLSADIFTQMQVKGSLPRILFLVPII